MRFVDLHLRDPEPGDQRLRHDATFEAWDGAVSALRDVANTGIRALNTVGAGLRTLPEGSLEELLVQPLTGDYGAIRQNARACFNVAHALGTWAENLTHIGLVTDPRWDGWAGTAFAGRLSVQAVAARTLSATVYGGWQLFREIADFSERLGITVEHLLVELGKAIARLARRLLGRVGGPAGWAAFTAEIAMRGLDAVTDIIDDVHTVIDLVDAVLDLQREVRDWAGEQHDRLRVFAELAA